MSGYRCNLYKTPLPVKSVCVGGGGPLSHHVNRFLLHNDNERHVMGRVTVAVVLYEIQHNRIQQYYTM